MNTYVNAAFLAVSILNAIAVIYLANKVVFYANKARSLDSMIHQLLHSKSIEEFEKKIINNITDGDMQKRHE